MAGNTLRTGIVTQVTVDGVWCEIPELASSQEFGPMELGPFVVNEGDRVLLGQVSGTLEDFVMLHPLVMQYTPPPSVVPTNGFFVRYYENAAARASDGTLTAVSGQPVWLDDESRFDVYTDESPARWVPLYGFDNSNTQKLPAGYGFSVGTLATAAATLDAQTAANTGLILAGSAVSDTNKRFTVQADGRHQWGSGSATADTSLYRSGANGLRINTYLGINADATSVAHTYVERDGANQRGVYIKNTGTSGFRDAIYIESSSAASANTVGALSTQVTGEANQRFVLAPTGYMSWGPGSAAVDTKLYRNSAGELKTDGNFTVVGTLTATGGVSGSLSGSQTLTGLTVNGPTALNGDLTVSGNMPDGVVRWVLGDILTAATAQTSGSTELIVFTLPSFTFKAGKIYRVQFNGMATVSTASSKPQYRVRKGTTTSGNQLATGAVYIGQLGTQTVSDWAGYFRVGASDVTTQIILTTAGSGTGTTFTTSVLAGATFNVFDEGYVSSRSANFTTQLVAI